MTNANKMFRKLHIAAWIIGLSLVAGGSSSAATTDISQEPLLSTTSGSVVLPNLMFMLDDSGSMDWDYMPDPAKNFAGKYGFNSNHCNGVYYDPNTTYAPPVKSDKSSYASSSFTAAWTDGYAATGSVNLSTTGFKGGSGTGSSGYNTLSVPAFYYNYSGTQTTGAQKDFHNTNSIFYKECISTIGSTTAVDGTHPVNTLFTKVVVSATSGPGSTDERTNFANWYSYYSTRMMMMKTGVGNAFKDITSNYRVGFMTMNNNVSPDFVDIAPFAGGCAVGSGTCQKDKWYTKLYAANPGSSTPLREALSHVGQLYAHKFGSITTYKATITVGGSGATTPTSIKVGGTEILNCAYLISIADPAAPAACPSASTSSAAATSIANEINAMITTDYGASVSGSVVTITGIPASTTPIITKDAGAMTFTPTNFVAATTTASLNGVTPADPMEYSCQQNFVILSTDGYWNGSTTYNLANSTVGNQDGTETRPMYDGAGLIQKTTTQLTKVTTQKLQSTVVQDQSQTYNLQTQSSQLQTQSSQLQSQASTLQGTLSKVLMTCANTTAACGTAPASGVAGVGSSTASWSVVASGTCVTAANVQCAAVSGLSGSVNVATSCNTAGSITNAGGSAGSATITITSVCTAGSCNGGNGASIDRVRFGSNEILKQETNDNTSQNTVASRIAAEINNCTGGTSGNCTVSGNSATVSNNVVTITGPSVTVAPTVRVSKGTATVTIVYTPGGGGTYTLNNADSNGKVYSACTYSDGSWTNASNCTAVAKSGSSPYTVLTSTQCRYLDGSWANTSSCTTVAKSGSSPYSVGTASQCQYLDGSWANTSSCTTVAKSGSSPYSVGTSTQCQYATGTLASVSSCTPIAQSASSPYTVGTAVTCIPGAVTSSIPVANCVAAPATAGNGYTTTTCPTPVVTGPTGVATCTAASATSGNSYTATTCSTVTVGPVSDASCVAASAASGNNYTATTCTAAGAGGTSDTLADVAEYYFGGVIGATGALGAAGAIDLRDNSLGNCTGALGTEVCTDNVPTSTTDKNLRQHMTTFTLGLGARGRMVYSPTYGSMTTACNPATDGDYCAVLKGATASSSVCTWQSAGTVCNWPTPSSGAIENIDDLWHAAVNGRGVYFSATDPATLESGLTSALTGIKSRLSAASASATSSPNITQTDRSIFSSTYLTGKWTGEVTAQLINTTTGVVETAISWTAQAQLDTLAQTDCASKAATPTCVTPDISTSRTIYTFDNGNGTNNLKNFLYASLTVTEKTYFDTKCSTTYLSQCDITMPVLDLAAGNLGTNLVNYLRGNQSKEISGSAGSFRVRDHLLGDTVNAKPAYVRLPQYSFTDAGYSAFIAAQASRQGVLYMGSNDGMLHAFNSDTGAEMWAYVPRIVLPNLYKLADQYYGATATPHQYYVDGSPETMDIYVAAATNNLTVGWHTILIGGLGRGGRGFYALDVTVPASPKALWEICDSALCAINDADMGYSYGNPVITKRSTDGKWVVLLSSGYNNVGNGQGTLFMLDAVTGMVLHKTSTGSGSAASPSGLAKLSPWVDSLATNHTTRFVYGGDLNGDVWRFDLGVAGADITPTVTKIASLKDASGVAQSVTTRVELGDPLSSTTNSLGGTGNPAIFVATGRYLGLSDLSNTQVQSVYAIKDDLAKTTSTTPSGYVGDPRTPAFGSFVKQYIFNIGTGETSRTTSTDIITTGCGQGCGPQYSVDWTTKQGWYADFAVSDPATTPPSALSPSPSPGERVNIDPLLINSTLIVVTNVPDTNACSIGGTSWMYSFDFRSGQYVKLPSDTLHIVGQKLGHALTAGIVLFSLPDGKIKAVVTLSDSEQITKDPTLQGSSPTRQTSWRELTTQ